MVTSSSCSQRRVIAVNVLRCLVGIGSLFPLASSSPGDADPKFNQYVEECASRGCLKSVCISGCSPGSGGPVPRNASAVMVSAPWELVAARWDCLSECKYQSMALRELERQERGAGPVKYFGKWPFRRMAGLQEPASVLLSLLNLGATLLGLLSFLSLVFHRLPRRPMGDKGPVYEYAGLFLLYGLVHANSWVWSAVFHARDTPITERLDYFSAIVVMGVGLLLAVIRTASLRVEAARVMVAAPIIAFVSTHILYLSFYSFDYGWNILVCTAMGVVQLLLWMIWAAVIRHPAALLVWLTCGGTGLALLLELYDFPPLWGFLDAHALWHATTIPLTLMWWSFVKEDAKFRTSTILSKAGKRSVKKTD